MLAGVSTDYYTRLEKGNIAGVSNEVLTAVATALQLDEAEQAHLFDLARAAKPTRTPRRTVKPMVRPSVQRMLDSMSSSPAFVRNGRLDILASNPLARALYAPLFQAPPVSPPNLARFNFLDTRSLEFYPDWNDASNTTVALLRTEAGRDPFNRELTDLVGELATRSEDFRVRWAAHDVRFHRTGIKRMHHPVVGVLELDFDAMELAADPGLTLTVYTAAPESPSDDGLKLLSSWAVSAAATTDDDGAAASSSRSHDADR